jgi:hypothetical protein
MLTDACWFRLKPSLERIEKLNVSGVASPFSVAAPLKPRNPSVPGLGAVAPGVVTDLLPFPVPP